MGKPGIMFYFSTRPCLKRLSLADKGRLFEALLDYGEFGTIPALDDSPGLAVAWDFMQQMLDRDGERYDNKVAQRRYAVYCRETKKQGGTTLSLEDWMKADGIEEHRPISDDVERHPITINSNNDNPISNDSISGNRGIEADKPPTPTRSRQRAKKEAGRHRYGRYGNVLLSDTEMTTLQSEFPDDHEERIERLSEYMASTGKTYKSHLATLRAWSRRDAEKVTTKKSTLPNYDVQEAYSL
jgi:hypothetical protein